MVAAISDPIHYAPVTRPYRRWLALSAALLLHLALLGLVAGWQLAPAPQERSSLDVVLVTHAAEGPVEAQAIAEADQLAAGDQTVESPAEQRAADLDDVLLPAQESGVEPAAPTDQPASEREPHERALPLAESPPAPSMAVPTPTASGRDLLAESATSVRQQGTDQSFTGQADEPPRAAAQRSAEARYVDDWTRRVEDYGNRVHPAAGHLDGQLRIRVVIGRDGQLRQAEVVQSSGHTELDQAALDTVHGAGPYRPFDSAMADLDSLSITRVWRFGQGNHFGGVR